MKSVNEVKLWTEVEIEELEEREEYISCLCCWRIQYNLTFLALKL